MDGLRNDVVCLDDSIKTFLDFEPLSYRQAILRALTREEQDRVSTRWSDAYPPAHELALKLHELNSKTTFKSMYSRTTDKPAAALFESVSQVGGKDGWLRSNWLWELRGVLDRVLMGVGMSRGRRSYSNLRINDVIDFWRIEDLQKNKRLLLRGEMKLPGRAWLEFCISEAEGRRKLAVTAYHDTHSVFGWAYWYGLLPFHGFIFMRLLKEIDRRS
jgi:hypothetical protein